MTRQAKKVSLLLALVITVCSVLSGAQPEASEALFSKSANALEQGRYAEAILALEALADRGFVHPDASYNRGLAYVARAQAGQPEPGDLGRAAAAFEETLLLRPDDEAAEQALEAVRKEIARRRARTGQNAVDVRPTLGKLVVGVLSVRTWSLLAILVGFLLAIGVVMRERRDGPIHVAGSVLAPTAAIALLVLLPMTLIAQHESAQAAPGVIVTTNALLSTRDGRPLPHDALPEGALVEVTDRYEARVFVEWGGAEGWLPTHHVRLLQRPR